MANHAFSILAPSTPYLAKALCQALKASLQPDIFRRESSIALEVLVCRQECADPLPGHTELLVRPHQLLNVVQLPGMHLPEQLICS